VGTRKRFHALAPLKPPLLGQKVKEETPPKGKLLEKRTQIEGQQATTLNLGKPNPFFALKRISLGPIRS